MTLLKKVLLRFVNKAIELLYPNTRRGAISLLVLNSPESSDILESVIGLTDAFFLDCKDAFSAYLKSDDYSDSVLDYLMTHKDIDDFSDFLYDGEHSYMSQFQKQFLIFTYNTNPFLSCLSSSDYILFQQYFNSEVSDFESYVVQNYMASLIGINAGMILSSNTEIFNN